MQGIPIYKLNELLIKPAIAGLGGFLLWLLIKISFVDKINPTKFFCDRKDAEVWLSEDPLEHVPVRKHCSTECICHKILLGKHNSY